MGAVRISRGERAYGGRVEAMALDGLLRAYPWPEGRWVRALMLQSLDGAVVGDDGSSRSLSCEADRQVLLEVRREAQAIVIGASTLRAERYVPMRATTRRLVVVSRSLDLPWELPLWTQSGARPIVATCAASDAQAREVAEEHADLIVLPGERVSLRDLLDALAERGITRVVVEGGPTLLAQALAQDIIDELDLTLAPLLVGRSDAPGALHDPPAAFALESLMTHEGYTFLRYLRQRPTADR